jgi:hypothetical protein
MSATPGFQILPVTAKPSGCPFFRRGGIPGRSVFQALVHISRRILHQFSENPEPKPFVFFAL